MLNKFSFNIFFDFVNKITKNILYCLKLLTKEDSLERNFDIKTNFFICTFFLVVVML